MERQSQVARTLRRFIAIRPALVLGLLAALLLSGGWIAPASVAAAECPGAENLRVPRAEQQKIACLDDLTTSGLLLSGHTNPADWAGLNASGTTNPTGVPGIQIDGYFPDSSTFNTNNGWNHDAQFVIRLPRNWNGKLVVSGAPGLRRQYANDFIISDWALARGYAFASTDKGNNGITFYRDGATPGDAVLEWHLRFAELTVAARHVVRQHYGKKPDFTYAAGISNGGYLVRFALEYFPHLYDGGLDWEGTLFRPEGPNLFTYLPPTLKNYPPYLLTRSQEAFDAIVAAGFPPETEFLWDLHYRVYWDLTQRVYREEFDPEYDGALEAGVPFCASGTPACDADYDYASRPLAVKAAVAKVSLTGKIKRPMITLHGTLDTLLPINNDANTYAQLIKDSNREQLHRYYVIEDGNHVDSFYDLFPDKLRPILPCARSAFEALEGWVEGGQNPPDSRFVPRPVEGDLVNSCSL